MPQPICSQYFSTFKLYTTLDNKTKLPFQIPFFPVPLSHPSKHACIMGSFEDLPPAKHHHQIPRMLPADALALPSWAGQGPSAAPRTGRNPHLQLNYPPTTAVCQGHWSRKTGGNTINLRSPPFLHTPSTRGEGIGQNTASKLTIKTSGTSNFPRALQVLRLCLFLHIVPESTHWRIRAATLRGFREVVADSMQNLLFHSNQPQNKKHSGSCYGSTESLRGIILIHVFSSWSCQIGSSSLQTILF